MGRFSVGINKHQLQQWQSELCKINIRSFAALGGVLGRGIYDNMNAAVVDKIHKAKQRLFSRQWVNLLEANLRQPAQSKSPHHFESHPWAINA